MKEKIIKIIRDQVKIFVRVENHFVPMINNEDKAAEEILKEMDKACCSECKYCSVMSGWCEYHDIEITDCEILKCNDFTEMEGK